MVARKSFWLAGLALVLTGWVAGCSDEEPAATTEAEPVFAMLLHLDGGADITVNRQGDALTWTSDTGAAGSATQATTGGLTHIRLQPDEPAQAVHLVELPADYATSDSPAGRWGVSSGNVVSWVGAVSVRVAPTPAE